MTAYLRRRLITTIPVILGVSFVVFIMLHILPGDPVLMMLTEHRGGTAPASAETITQETYDNMRAYLGLDDPLPVQFGNFLIGAVQGDLGRSFRSQDPVLDIIIRNLPHTIRLAIASLGVAVVIGLVLGTLSALKRGTWLDGAIMSLAVLGVSMPNFWLGIMLILVFSLYLGLIPAVGAGGIGIILPAFALGTGAAGIMARLVRSSLIDVMNQDYIRTARAKGLRPSSVMVRHALKNALIPVVTVAGLQFGNLLGGTVVIETVFARPGVGHVAVNAILGRDFPVIQGVVLFAALTYVFANLCVDLMYAWLDPRISL
jgi:peptide/nickel transport system permease protein